MSCSGNMSQLPVSSGTLQRLVLDLNVTQQCNYRCKYCIETGEFGSQDCTAILPDFMRFIDRLLETRKYEICIGLWGGEPTLKDDEICNLIQSYKMNPRITFLMYTNGFKFSSRLKELIVSMKDVSINGTPKFLTQISYDGMPIQDLKRVKLNGGATSQDTQASIHWALETGIPFSLKSTVTVDTLKYLHMAYKDIAALLQGSQAYTSTVFFPTLDYFNNISGENLEQYAIEMVTSLKNIAAQMLLEKRRGSHPLGFKWFMDDKADCSAGVNLFSVDVDGKIYVCHGCFYSDCKSDFLVGSIQDDASILEQSQQKHAPILHQNPLACDSCEATFCVRCNVTRYGTSNLDSYAERWKDYTNNPSVCSLYKEAGKVARAYWKASQKV